MGRNLDEAKFREDVGRV
ncbi:hypothetical protein QUB80_19020 [Chlorogloeopsis sp. ULAP01]|nr:hypothetical protein [Chlorogloeopsis sp. ULAP01]MDM9382788.1 hypothetical protein [Chlorogloeopsis sp. ULAP01]